MSFRCFFVCFSRACKSDSFATFCATFSLHLQFCFWHSIQSYIYIYLLRNSVVHLKRLSLGMNTNESERLEWNSSISFLCLVFLLFVQCSGILFDWSRLSAKKNDISLKNKKNYNFQFFDWSCSYFMLISCVQCCFSPFPHVFQDFTKIAPHLHRKGAYATGGMGKMESFYNFAN